MDSSAMDVRFAELVVEHRSPWRPLTEDELRIVTGRPPAERSDLGATDRATTDPPARPRR